MWSDFLDFYRLSTNRCFVLFCLRRRGKKGGNESETNRGWKTPLNQQTNRSRRLCADFLPFPFLSLPFPSLSLSLSKSFFFRRSGWMANPIQRGKRLLGCAGSNHSSQMSFCQAPVFVSSPPPQIPDLYPPKVDSFGLPFCIIIGFLARQFF